MATALAGVPPAASADGGARIGPNAILQMVPVLDAHTGADIRRSLLAEAGVLDLPDGSGMIPEGPAAALHQALRRRLPHEAPQIAREAGLGTGDYILAHRIPRPAQALLRVLPARLAAPILARAIARHAWTFAGSGTFAIAARTPLTFTLADNPVVRGERSAVPLCAWHEAVFERLFRSLVSPRARVTETQCCAQGAPACRFEVRLR
ncbi:MAG: bacteriochlorophyll 4-vinyl reductase [Paracoccaceae bacterium]|jgi:divinyl protochlorophyllide a 8-vinyl-reductase|nr:bacteriochlorophyll 4-vinyl reductase [Paracoccaceae bacterium]